MPKKNFWQKIRHWPDWRQVLSRAQGMERPESRFWRQIHTGGGNIISIRPLRGSPLKKCIIAEIGSVHRLANPTPSRFAVLRGGMICIDDRTVRIMGKVKIVGFDGLYFLVRPCDNPGICDALAELIGRGQNSSLAKPVYCISALDFCDGVARGVMRINNPFVGEDFL